MNQVSIIIPTYNSARYIPAALESVFDQGYPACQVIVVDDGSTDETRLVLQPYLQPGAPRIRYVYQENAGSASARNHGLEYAQGEFVIFLDADDFFLPGKLAAQVAQFETNPSLGCVHSGWLVVSQEGETVAEMKPWQYVPHLDLEGWLLWKPVKLCAMMFRREWLQRVGGLNPALRQAHDVDLALRLSLAGCQFAWLRRPTIAYRQHDSNTTLDGRKQVQSMDKVLDNFFARPDLPGRIRRREGWARYSTLLWSAWHLYRTGYMDEMVAYLQKSLAYSPYSEVETLLSWAERFAEWLLRYGRSPEDLAALLPLFQAAASCDEQQWAQAAELLRWWIGKQPTPETLTLFTLWRYYATAVPFAAGSGVPVGPILDWWLAARARYWREGEDALPHLPPPLPAATPRQLVRLVQMLLPAGPEPAEARHVARLWRDWLDQGIVPPSSRHEASALYLTVFGQGAMAGQWRITLGGLKGAIRSGLHPQAMRAWGRFLRAAVVHFRSARHFRSAGRLEW